MAEDRKHSATNALTPRTVDADTIEIEGRRRRLMGLAASETSTEAGRAAAHSAEQFLSQPGVTFEAAGTGYYGRPVGTAYGPPDESGARENLNERLIEEGLAVPHDFIGAGNLYPRATRIARQGLEAVNPARALLVDRSTPRGEDAPTYVPPEPSLTQSIAAGASQATDSLQAGAYGFASSLAALIAPPEDQDPEFDTAIERYGRTARSTFEKGYMRNSIEASRMHVAKSLEELMKSPDTSFSDWARWAAFNIGVGLPSLGLIIGSGGTGALVGVGARFTARKLGYGIGKYLRHKGVDRNTAKLLGDGIVERLPKYGARLGAALGSGVPQGGSIYEDVKNKYGVDSTATAVVTAAITGGADVVGLEFVLRGLLPDPKKHLSEYIAVNFGKMVGVGAARGIIAEAPIEAFQEAVAITAEGVHDPDETVMQKLFSEEGKWRILEAAAAGAVFGSVFGGTGGALSYTAQGFPTKRPDAPPPPPTEEVEAAPPLPPPDGGGGPAAFQIDETPVEARPGVDPYAPAARNAPPPAADAGIEVGELSPEEAAAAQAEAAAQAGKPRPGTLQADANRLARETGTDTRPPPPAPPAPVPPALLNKAIRSFVKSQKLVKLSNNERAALVQTVAQTLGKNSATDAEVKTWLEERGYIAENVAATAAAAAASAAGEQPPEKPSTYVQPLEEVAAEGDQASSPWLMPNGDILGTGQDHLSAIPKEHDDGTYSTYMKNTNAVRASFFTEQDGTYVATLHLAEGQDLTEGQLATLIEIEKQRGEPIKVLIGKGDGLTNPEYQETTVSDLVEDKIDATQVRSDQGQTDQSGRADEGSEVPSGAGVQQPAKAGAGTGDGTSQAEEKPKSEPVSRVNIHAGQKENADLSNFAPRKFTFGGREYDSVEHAYQSLKSGEFNEAVYEAAKGKTGFDAKKAGRGQKRVNDKKAYELMVDLLEKSFDQNPTARQRLLDTGDAVLTHEGRGVSGTPWAEMFPKALTEVRTRLREKGPEEQAEPTPHSISAASNATLTDIEGSLPEPKTDKYGNVLYNLRSRSDYIKKYGFSIPTAEMLRAIVEAVRGKRVIMPAAGKGLWAKLLRNEGIEVEASDLKAQADAFTDIAVKDGVEAVKGSTKDSVLFLSWPEFPHMPNWVIDALDNFNGDTIVYIGEQEGESSMDEESFVRMKKEFSYDKNVSVNAPTFDGIHDGLVIYRRKKKLDTPTNPVRRVAWLSRDRIENDPDTLYVFGDNMKRTGRGGQAKEARGLPNAVGVPTKRAPGTKESDYFTDDDFDAAVVEIDKAEQRLREHLEKGGKVVIPEAGLGTGRADLEKRAPKIWSAVLNLIGNIEGFGDYIAESGGAEVAVDELNRMEGRDILTARADPIELTEDQTNALTGIAGFMDKNNSEDSNSVETGMAELIGYAGTGKTTIVENIVRHASSRGRPVLVWALTNKAVSVLRQKLEKDGAPAEVTTIHSGMYGAPVKDRRTGRIRFEPEKEIDPNTLIIVDESSMVDAKIFGDMQQKLRIHRGLQFLFIGDNYQIEQVGKASGLLTDESIVPKSNKFRMSKVMRQATDSDVLVAATKTRNDQKPSYPAESTDQFTVFDSEGAFLNEFKAEVSKNQADTVMIVATNAQRRKANQIARQGVYGERAQKSAILENEQLLAISTSNEAGVSNSELMSLPEGVPDESPLDSFEIKVKANGKTYPIQIIRFIAPVKMGDKTEKQTIYFIPHTDKASLYKGEIAEVLSREQFNELTKLGDMDLSSGAQGGTVSSEGIWEPGQRKPNGRIKGDIIVATYGYAMTAHKAQGSEWKTAFVNHSWMHQNWNSGRWYYTGITRASERVRLLPNKNAVAIDMEAARQELAPGTKPKTETKTEAKPKTETVSPAGTIETDELPGDVGTNPFGSTETKTEPKKPEPRKRAESKAKQQSKQQQEKTRPARPATHHVPVLWHNFNYDDGKGLTPRPGFSGHLFEAVASGQRTSTTRAAKSHPWLARVNAGDTITTKASGGRQLKLRVKWIDRQTKGTRLNQAFMDAWSKAEGWTVESLASYTGMNKVGNEYVVGEPFYIIQYEVIEQSGDTKTTPVPSKAKETKVKPAAQASKSSVPAGAPTAAFSGGAPGSDTFWAAMLHRFGIPVTNISFAEHSMKGGVRGTRVNMTPAQLAEAMPAYKAATAKLGRRGFPEGYSRNLQLRNYYQVKDADVVYAVGTLKITNATVDGGTGYAVEYALQMGKPVYLFDQRQKRWFKLSPPTASRGKNNIEPVEPERLEGGAVAVVGTRDLTDDGKQAIAEIVEATYAPRESGEQAMADIPTGQIPAATDSYRGWFQARVNVLLEGAPKEYADQIRALTAGGVMMDPSLAREIIAVTDAFIDKAMASDPKVLMGVNLIGLGRKGGKWSVEKLNKKLQQRFPYSRHRMVRIEGMTHLDLSSPDNAETERRASETFRFTLSKPKANEYRLTKLVRSWAKMLGMTTQEHNLIVSITSTTDNRADGWHRTPFGSANVNLNLLYVNPHLLMPSWVNDVNELKRVIGHEFGHFVHLTTIEDALRNNSGRLTELALEMEKSYLEWAGRKHKDTPDQLGREFEVTDPDGRLAKIQKLIRKVNDNALTDAELADLVNDIRAVSYDIRSTRGILTTPLTGEMRSKQAGGNRLPALDNFLDKVAKGEQVSLQERAAAKAVIEETLLINHIRDYLLSHKEWYAEQINRWLHTNEEAKSILERFFQFIARAVKQFFGKRKEEALDVKPPVASVKEFMDYLQSLQYKPKPRKPKNFALNMSAPEIVDFLAEEVIPRDPLYRLAAQTLLDPNTKESVYQRNADYLIGGMKRAGMEGTNEEIQNALFSALYAVAMGDMWSELTTNNPQTDFEPVADAVVSEDDNHGSPWRTSFVQVIEKKTGRGGALDVGFSIKTLFDHKYQREGIAGLVDHPRSIRAVVGDDSLPVGFFHALQTALEQMRLDVPMNSKFNEMSRKLWHSAQIAQRGIQRDPENREALHIPITPILYDMLSNSAKKHVDDFVADQNKWEREIGADSLTTIDSLTDPRGLEQLFLTYNPTMGGRDWTFSIRTHHGSELVWVWHENRHRLYHQVFNAMVRQAKAYVERNLDPTKDEEHYLKSTLQFLEPATDNKPAKRTTLSVRVITSYGRSLEGDNRRGTTRPQKHVLNQERYFAKGVAALLTEGYILLDDHELNLGKRGTKIVPQVLKSNIGRERSIRFANDLIIGYNDALGSVNTLMSAVEYVADEQKLYHEVALLEFQIAKIRERVTNLPNKIKQVQRIKKRAANAKSDKLRNVFRKQVEKAENLLLKEFEEVYDFVYDESTPYDRELEAQTAEVVAQFLETDELIGMEKRVRSMDLARRNKTRNEIYYEASQKLNEVKARYAELNNKIEVLAGVSDSADASLVAAERAYHEARIAYADAVREKSKDVVRLGVAKDKAKEAYLDARAIAGYAAMRKLQALDPENITDDVIIDQILHDDIHGVEIEYQVAGEKVKRVVLRRVTPSEDAEAKVEPVKEAKTKPTKGERQSERDKAPEILNPKIGTVVTTTAASKFIRDLNTRIGGEWRLRRMNIGQTLSGLVSAVNRIIAKAQEEGLDLDKMREEGEVDAKTRKIVQRYVQELSKHEQRVRYLAAKLTDTNAVRTPPEELAQLNLDLQEATEARDKFVKEIVSGTRKDGVDDLLADDQSRKAILDFVTLESAYVAEAAKYVKARNKAVKALLEYLSENEIQTGVTPTMTLVEELEIPHELQRLQQLYRELKKATQIDAFRHGSLPLLEARLEAVAKQIASMKLLNDMRTDEIKNLAPLNNILRSRLARLRDAGAAFWQGQETVDEAAEAEAQIRGEMAVHEIMGMDEVDHNLGAEDSPSEQGNQYSSGIGLDPITGIPQTLRNFIESRRVGSLAFEAGFLPPNQKLKGTITNPMLETIQNMIRITGLDRFGIDFNFGWNKQEGMPSQVTIWTEPGAKTHKRRIEVTIRIDPALKGKPQAMLHDLAHEIAHVMKDALLGVEENKNSAAWRKLMKGYKQYADGTENPVAFEEWFADHFANWLVDTTFKGRKIKNAAESFMQGLRDKIVALFKLVDKTKTEENAVYEFLDELAVITTRDMLPDRIYEKNRGTNEVFDEMYMRLRSRIPAFGRKVTYYADGGRAGAIPISASEQSARNRVFAMALSGANTVWQDAVQFTKEIYDRYIRWANRSLWLQKNANGDVIKAIRAFGLQWASMPGHARGDVHPETGEWHDNVIFITRPNGKIESINIGDEVIEASIHRERGKWIERRMVDMINKLITPENHDAVLGVLQGELDLNQIEDEGVRKVAAEFRNFLEGFYDDYIGAMYQSRGAVDEAHFGVKKWNTNYFPRVLDPDVLMEKKDQFIEDLMTKLEFTHEAAENLWQSYMGNDNVDVWYDPDRTFAPGNPHGKSRQQLLAEAAPVLAPYMVKDLSAVLQTYMSAMIKRIEYERRYGGIAQTETGAEYWDHDVRFNRLVRLAREAGASESQIKWWSDVKEAYLGRLGADIPPQLRRFFSLVQTFMSVLLLPFATLSSFVDLANVIIRSNGTVTFSLTHLREAFRAVREKGDNELWQLAQSHGLVVDNIMHSVVAERFETGYLTPMYQRINEKFFRLIGLHQWTAMMRIYAWQMGKDFIHKHATKRTKYGDEYLKEIGLTADEVNRWFHEGHKVWEVSEGTENDELARKVTIGLNRFVSESIFRPDATQRPKWASDPHYMLLWHLKQFGYSFWANLIHRLFDVAKTRPDVIAKIVVFLPVLAVLPFAMVGMELRNLIQYGLSDEVPYNHQKGMDGYFAELVSRSGGLGPMQFLWDAVEAQERGKLFALSLMGPAFTMGESVASSPISSSIPKLIPGMSAMPPLRHWMTEQISFD